MIMTISIMSVSTDPGALFCVKRVIIGKGAIYEKGNTNIIVHGTRHFISIEFLCNNDHNKCLEGPDI